MKHHRIAVISALLILLAPVHKAAAVGNVLLPDSSNNSTGSLLAPTPAPAPQQPAQQPATTPQPSTPAPAQPQASSSASTTGVLPYTPAPQPTPSPVTPFTLTPPTPSVARDADGHYSVQLPTTVIQVPPPMIMPSDPNAKPPSQNIVIDLTSNKWDAKDLEQVNSKLGIPKDKVPSLCYLNASGFIMTGQMPAMFDTGATLHANVGYDGTIRNVMATLRIMCAIVPLAPNLGYVRQLGDKYLVELGIASCAPPASSGNAPPQQVSIIHDTAGGFMGRCQFQ